MKFLSKLTSLAIAALLLFSGLTAYAAAPPTVPDDRECSLSVEVKSGETLVKEGALSVYKIGEVTTGVGPDSGSYYYYYVDAMASALGVDKSALADEDLSDDELAGKLADKLSAAGMNPAATDSLEDGKAVFTGLEMGLYLVAQTTAGISYMQIQPYLVSLPYYTEENGYIYDFDASAKTEPVSPYPPAKPVIFDPAVKKVIDGKDAPNDAAFPMVFKRSNDESPMMAQADGASRSMDVPADGNIHSFGEISFTQPGTYEYYAYENGNHPLKDFDYDTSVYKYVVKVDKDASKNILKFTDITITKDGKEYYHGTDGTKDKIAITFTNTYEKTVPPEEKPNTPENKPPKPATPTNHPEQPLPPTTPPEMMNITGMKIWSDANNAAGKRPTSIVIHLYADGTEIDSTVVTGDTWSFDFGQRTVWKSGNQIQYTISEDAVPEYQTQITSAKNSEGLTFYVTNALVETATEPPVPITPGNQPGPGAPRTTRLPQTGQYWWPVWLMAGLGIVFVATGLVIRRRSR
jgi:LPXTG-motif cell wall-anchored protein